MPAKAKDIGADSHSTLSEFASVKLDGEHAHLVLKATAENSQASREILPQLLDVSF